MAACFLAIGVVLGVLLSRPSEKVRAVDREMHADLSSAFVEIAKRVEPTVVNVTTVTQPVKRTNSELSIQRQSIEGLPFGNPDNQARRGNGSGVIIDPQGYILTNHHVVQGADRIKVRLYDGNEYPGRVIGSDQETDLAVVKIDPAAPLSAARMGDSEKMNVGDWVLAIGSPFGLDQTVTAGIISAKERKSADVYQKAGFQYFLQTDAAINHGNSGGPLININGEVIGINTAIITSTGDYNGICFALGSSEAITIYRQLIADGHVVRGFLGAMAEPVTPQIAKVYGLPITRGAIVSNVSETMMVDGRVAESPAARAGLKPSDVIVEFRGDRIKDDSELIRRVASTPVGTNAPLKIYRDGREMNISVTIGRRPGTDIPLRVDSAAAAAVGAPPRTQSIGIGLQSLAPQRTQRKEISSVFDKTAGSSRGVLVVSVDPGSIADDADIKPNDIIEMINREPVKDNQDFKRVLNQLKSGDPVVLQVYRETFAPNARIFRSFNKP
ncbi:MAG: trypsin-like peptidase domain-containing protein [Blastocatellia bacterium]|nr:trypsin-like peptidase domain-containing protein [Blastocatellia bacterium]